MAEKQYLSYKGLQDVAGHVNTRLKTVTTIPASADDGAVRLYVGETGVTYKKGHIYQYNATDLEWVDITSSSEYTAGNGIDITDNEISVETYIFTGTQAQWDALTTDQKKEYDICNITDDASSDDEIYTKSEIDAMLGTAASKDYTDVVRPNDHDLVESNAVYAAINNALSSIYTPRGDLTCAELTSALLIEQNVGNVYQMTDSGTTSALFINGAGHTINVNDNVGIIKAGQDTYLFNLMGNAFDLHDYQKKDLETPITIGGVSRTTVESALGALNDVDATKANLTQISNPNLLDNPWFTINQRGFTTDTTATKLYTVDRWYINNSKATFSNGIMEIELGAGGGSVRPRFAQATEHIIKVGNRYTLTLIAKISVESGYNAPSMVLMRSDGSYDGSKYGLLYLHDTGNNYETFSYSFAPTEDIDNLGVAIIAPITTAVKQSTVSIKTIKLELGSVSTLAMDTAPNTATELMKCQRYFQRIYNYNSDSPAEIGVSMARTTSVIPLMIPYIVPMIATPTASISTNAILYSRSDSASAVVASGMSASYGTTLGKVLNINGSNLTVGEIYRMLLAANSYIDLSADL